MSCKNKFALKEGLSKLSSSLEETIKSADIVETINKHAELIDCDLLMLLVTTFGVLVAAILAIFTIKVYRKQITLQTKQKNISENQSKIMLFEKRYQAFMVVKQLRDNCKQLLKLYESMCTGGIVSGPGQAPHENIFEFRMILHKINGFSKYIDTQLVDKQLNLEKLPHRVVRQDFINRIGPFFSYLVHP